MKFLGNNQDGSGGPEQTFNLESGQVGHLLRRPRLGLQRDLELRRHPHHVGHSGFLNIVSVTSTPGFGGTLSQTIPAVFSSDLIPAGSSRSILYIREGDGFRSNLILASNANVSTTVDAALVSPAGTTLATKSYSVPPNGMTQINRIVRDMGVSGPSPAPGSCFPARPPAPPSPASPPSSTRPPTIPPRWSHSSSPRTRDGFAVNRCRRFTSRGFGLDGCAG